MIWATDLATVGLWAMIFGFANFARVAEIATGANVTRYVAGLDQRSQRTLLSFLRLGLLGSIIPVTLLGVIIAPFIVNFSAGREGLTLAHDKVVALTAIATL